MIVTKQAHSGAWEISDIEGSAYLRRVYYGYTKREAMRLFRHEFKELVKQGGR